MLLRVAACRTKRTGRSQAVVVVRRISQEVALRRQEEAKDVHNRFSDGARIKLLMANSSTEVLMVNLSTTTKLWIAHSPCLGIELVIGNSLWSTKALADQPPIACLSFVEHSRPHIVVDSRRESVGQPSDIAEPSQPQSITHYADSPQATAPGQTKSKPSVLSRGINMGIGERGALADPNSEGTVDKGHREGQRTLVRS